MIRKTKLLMEPPGKGDREVVRVHYPDPKSVRRALLLIATATLAALLAIAAATLLALNRLTP
jgi:hypothetical protein